MSTDEKQQQQQQQPFALSLDSIGIIPHIDIIGVDTLPDHLFHPGSANNNAASLYGSGSRSRFNRPIDRTSDGANLEDLADFAIHTQHDADQAAALLNALYEKYLPEDLDGNSMRLKAYELWGLDPEVRPDLMRVEEEYRRSLFQAYQVYQQLLYNNMIGNRDNETLQNQRKVAMVFEVLYLMRDFIMAEQRWRSMCDPSMEVRIPEEVQIFKFSPFDYSTTNAYQNLLIYLLQQAYIRGYRRFNDKCYEQIKTRDGYNTHAWREVSTIMEMIHKVVQKEGNFEMWKALTHAANIDKNASNYLQTHNDVEFPPLEVNRHVFAFSNGLLMLGGFKKDKKNMITDPIYPEFHPYDSHPVPESVVACKFFDQEFHYLEYFEYDDWYSIPTPAFQSILDFQQFGDKKGRDPEEVKIMNEQVARMMYIMIGRLQYDVNEHDTWQVMPFLKGVANSGKSSILRAVYWFYQPEKVGIMTSNMEKKFWASALYDKFVFLCYEARADFAPSQGEIQSAISGEEMSVSIKYETAISLTWKVPGIMAGNEVPNWLDALGSMTRRLLVFYFRRMVRDSDPTLLKKLRAETPALLYKCNMAYLSAVREHGNQPIWKWWPSYFSETQQEIAANIDPLRYFLENTTQLVRKPEYYIPIDVFWTYFKAFCENRNMPRRAVKEDKYIVVFQAYGLTVNKDETLEYDGRMERTEWLQGIGVREIWEPQPNAVPPQRPPPQ